MRPIFAAFAPSPQSHRSLFVAASILSLLQPLAVSGEDASPSRPNILFIFTDDHATAAIGAYGSSINETPHMDRLASEGMLFRNCFCTNSICAPSRAVVLTGKYSHLNGKIDNRGEFDGAQTTFPKLLQAAGYETAMIGKWHLGSEPTGFDHWEVLIGQGHYYNPEFRVPGGMKTYTGYATDVVTDLTLEWLREDRDPNKPFLLMTQHKAPHRNWMPGPDHLTLYDGVEIPEPATLFDDYSNRNSGAKTQEMSIANHMYESYDLKIDPTETLEEREKDLWDATYGRMNDDQRRRWDAAYGPRNDAFREAGLEGDELVRWRYQRYIKDYLRCIASVDDNIGRLLEYLDESGLAENTLVVYSSDQGFYLGEHGWYDKRWMYEQSLEMPLIMRWPGVIQPGAENADLVQNLDFAQTFLQVAGVVPPQEMQGASLLPLLKGETPPDWRTSIYYHYYENPGAHNVPRHYGVRTDRYKLIHYYQLGEWELIDLEKDPLELRSFHGEKEYAAIQADLEKELERLRKVYRVPEDS